MPESGEHMLLVQALRRWIADEHLKGDLGTVLSDSAGTAATGRSREIGGYVPDVFVGGTERNSVIVGEAKCADDLENRHAWEQIEAFLSYCNRVRGLLVIAVPWHRVAYVRNLLGQLSRRKGLDISGCRVLDFLPG